MVEELVEDDQKRADFLKACLAKLDLQVNEEHNPVPSLSWLHLSSSIPSETAEVVEALQDIILTEEGEDYIKDDNDTFHIAKSPAQSPDLVDDFQTDKNRTEHGPGESNEDKILNYSIITKHIRVHDEQYPHNKETPYFNHHAFYANLKQFQLHSNSEHEGFGKHILYGEVVTSTNTILEKYAYSSPALHRK